MSTIPSPTLFCRNVSPAEIKSDPPVKNSPGNASFSPLTIFASSTFSSLRFHLKQTIQFEGGNGDEFDGSDDSLMTTEPCSSFEGFSVDTS